MEQVNKQGTSCQRNKHQNTLTCLFKLLAYIDTLKHVVKNTLVSLLQGSL